MMRLLVALTLVALCNPSFSQVYRWQAPDGSIIFSDEPPEKGAEPVELEPLQTYSAPAAPKSTSASSTPTVPTATTGDKPPFKYTGLAIGAPANDEGVRSNNGQIVVQVKVTPGLNSEDGHQLAILLDGKLAAGPDATTTFTLENIPRGTHSVAAEVRDKTGKTVKTSAAISFHVLRTTAGGAP